MATLTKSRHSPHRRTKVVAGELVLTRASRHSSNSLLPAELKDRFARHKLQCLSPFAQHAASMMVRRWRRLLRVYWVELCVARVLRVELFL
ncbi:hypothetical protein NL676_014605 [Syzygium grande]|nr:hypothetical protein NL676_014605 [Syzygium grande]